MKISKTGIDLIKKWEGGPWLEAKRFGSEKYLSIGYGHYGPDVRMGMKITKAQAEDLLLKDISGAEAKVNKLNDTYGYKFNQNEFDALVSFCYNIGNVMQVSANGTRTKKQIGDKMLLYVNSCGKKLQGLVNRRNDEHKLYVKKVSSSSSGSEAPASSKKKSNEAIAKEVIQGKWGNGTSRKKKLTEAGYDYAAIQKLVNKMLKESKK